MGGSFTALLFLGWSARYGEWRLPRLLLLNLQLPLLHLLQHLLRGLHAGLIAVGGLV
jgi:hypothetical protein